MLTLSIKVVGVLMFLLTLVNIWTNWHNEELTGTIILLGIAEFLAICTLAAIEDAKNSRGYENDRL